MPQSRPAGAPESYPIASCRERWLEFLVLEHETLAAAVDYGGDGEQLLVRREPAPGRALTGSRIPRPWRAPLLLQAASAAAFFASRGFPLAPEDLDDAHWEASGGVPRLGSPALPAPSGRRTRLPSATRSRMSWPGSSRREEDGCRPPRRAPSSRASARAMRHSGAASTGWPRSSGPFPISGRRRPLRRSSAATASEAIRCGAPRRALSPRRRARSSAGGRRASSRPVRRR